MSLDSRKVSELAELGADTIDNELDFFLISDTSENESKKMVIKSMGIHHIQNVDMNSNLTSHTTLLNDDLFFVQLGASGVNKKIAASDIKTYMAPSAPTYTESVNSSVSGAFDTLDFTSVSQYTIECSGNTTISPDNTSTWEYGKEYLTAIIPNGFTVSTSGITLATTMNTFKASASFLYLYITKIKIGGSDQIIGRVIY